MNETLAFLGAGNMARSLISGLIQNGWNPSALWATDINPQTLHALNEGFTHIHTTDDNALALAHAEVVVLAVKPQSLAELARAIAPQVAQRKPLLISIAAGVTLGDLEHWLGGEAALVRCMPNTPALIGCGATALFANARVSPEQRALAESILRAVGLTVWLEEEGQLDAVTALSGSGPAYFFLIMEALEDAGVSLGLERDTARLLALQTAFGAAKLALESDEDAATLRARVTSRGGTTEQALAVLEQGRLRDVFQQALEAAHHRSRELAQQLGQDGATASLR
ncbi:pyrroline-5-carboxylate reductase [Thiorhodospira sibirica]|uniref:pyrroline-5-carboxylate reductase n=1 Tax=Thiorhodospira sibirica TaxID=154347 RepID=UPI00022C0ABC|nr:pyrroline-5-carboxylate reductase [Thiorhodospira sibirica]